MGDNSIFCVYGIMVSLELWIIYNYGLWLNLGDNYKFCKTKNLMVDRHCVKVANLYSVTVCGLLSGFRNYVGGLPTLRGLGLYIWRFPKMGVPPKHPLYRFFIL